MPPTYKDLFMSYHIKSEISTSAITNLWRDARRRLQWFVHMAEFWPFAILPSTLISTDTLLTSRIGQLEHDLVTGAPTNLG